MLLHPQFCASDEEASQCILSAHSRISNASLTFKGIQRLRHGGKLNCDVINFYMAHFLQAKYPEFYFASPNLFSYLQWTGRDDYNVKQMARVIAKVSVPPPLPWTHGMHSYG